jgi:cell division protein FtsL
MVTDLSSRYKSGIGRRPAKKSGGQKLQLGGWFWKLTGLIMVVATLVGMAGSFWFSWSIRRGLDELTAERGEKLALQQVSANLQAEQVRLFDQKRIEAVAAAKLALYPTVEQSAGGGVIVRVPEP